MLSRSRRDDDEQPRPKPFPYEKKNYGLIPEIFDRTNARMNENSRMILLDGAHAVGKSDLAHQLAEEFDMKVFGFPSMTNFYKDYYGVSLREYAGHLHPVNRPWDETDFSRDPTSPFEGSCDRFIIQNWFNILNNYAKATAHLLNTGQGVIVEGNPWSDYAHFEAAYNQGWVERTTRSAYKESTFSTLYLLQRPHVIIYLDAPAEAVMKNIKARGNPWDKNSPVWTNRRYLNDIYNEKKRRYLPKQQKHSHVLVYDWATPGETEIVVDDLEKLELDFADEYDDLLRDWTENRSELYATRLRARFSNHQYSQSIYETAISPEEFVYCEHMDRTPDDAVNLDTVLSYMPSTRFAPGFNRKMGDTNIWANCNQLFGIKNMPPYWPGVFRVTRPGDFFSNDEYLDPYPIPSPDEQPEAAK